MYTFYEKTIIDSIDFTGYEDDADIFGDYPLYTDIQNIYYIFKKEYVHKNNQFINEEILFKEWLQGLPSVLTVPFYNHDILENAKKEYLLKSESNDWFKEREEEKFLDNYWTRLSLAFFNLKDNLQEYKDSSQIEDDLREGYIESMTDYWDSSVVYASETILKRLDGLIDADMEVIDNEVEAV